MLETKKSDGSIVKIECLIYSIGIAVAAPPLSGYQTSLEITTPGIFGYKSWALAGPVTYVSATAAVGVGVTSGTIHIGSGIGELSIFSGVRGYDIGLDWMEGWSIAWQK